MPTCIYEHRDCVVCPWQNDMTDMHNLAGTDDEASDKAWSYSWSAHTVGLHVKYTKIHISSNQLTN